MDWSLLACGRSGHVTYAPAEPAVRKRLTAQTEYGEAWRCLRCGAFAIGEPQRSGPAAQAPPVRRGQQVRSTFILRVFAIERFLRALAVGVLAVVVWRFLYAQVSIEQAFDRDLPAVRTLFRQLGYNIDNSGLVGLIHHALTLHPTTIRLLAGGLALYAVIELVEGTGLWLAQRWGEYFAMVATSVFLPYEVYDLTLKVTVTRVLFFAINLALVLYLVITKRLFGVRGGKRAYEARLRSESIMQAAIDAAAADQAEGLASRSQAPAEATASSQPAPTAPDRADGADADRPDVPAAPLADVPTDPRQNTR